MDMWCRHAVETRGSIFMMDTDAGLKPVPIHATAASLIASLGLYIYPKTLYQLSAAL